MTITLNSLIRHDSAEVVNYNEIDNVVALRDRAVDLYTQGLKLIAESVSLAKNTENPRPMRGYRKRGNIMFLMISIF